MTKLLKWLLLATLALVGLAWKLVQGFFALMPGDGKLLPEVPASPAYRDLVDAHAWDTHTADGRTIID
jgi:hypothetical protein